MAERRRYTKRQKVTAVIAADMTSQEAAAAAAGVPRTTLRYWLNDPELAELRHNAREAMAEEATVTARLAWGKLIEAIKANRLEPRDLIIAAGMATDKSQLLAGHATERMERRELDTFDDHETRALVDAARKHLGGDTAAEGEALAEEPAVEAPGA